MRRVDAWVQRTRTWAVGAGGGEQFLNTSTQQLLKELRDSFPLSLSNQVPGSLILFFPVKRFPVLRQSSVDPRL